MRFITDSDPINEQGKTRTTVKLAWWFHKLMGENVKVIWERYERFEAWQEEIVPILEDGKTKPITIGRWVILKESLINWERA